MASQKIGINANDLIEDQPKKVELGDKTLVVVMHKGNPYCLNSVCTHEVGQLEDGYVDGDELICPMHGGAFEIATGKANENTAWVTDTKAYALTTDENGEISIEI